MFLNAAKTDQLYEASAAEESLQGGFVDYHSTPALPAWYSNPTEPTYFRPEQRLYCAILTQAYRDLCSKHASTRHAAIEWLATDTPCCYLIFLGYEKPRTAINNTFLIKVPSLHPVYQQKRREVQRYGQSKPLATMAG